MTASLGATAPLLPAQRFRWEAYQRAPDSLDLVITVRLRIRGRLDRAALVASLQALQEAQPALRATFRPERAAARPFRLDRPCALRAQLIRLAELDHLLVVCASGMVVDGWSIGIIFRCLGAGCRSLAAGQPLVAADHSDENLECCHATSLAAVPGGPHATARLRRTSSAVVLFAAFNVLLARSSGRRRFAVGAFVSGRTRPEMPGLIGRFAHMAALPDDYHQVPLASIAEKTGIDTPPGRLPVCDVTFVHLFGEQPVSFGDHLSIHRERVPTPISPHDLTLFVEPDGTDGLGVRLEYRTDLFRETTPRTALTRFRAVLAELTEEIPDQKGTADD
jgi:hypothetical protein